MPSFRAKYIFIETGTQDICSILWVLFLQSSRRKEIFGLDGVFLSCLVFKLQKISLSVLEFRTVCRSCSLCFWNLSSKQQLRSWCRFSILRSFRPTVAALTETGTQDTFTEFWPYCILFLVSRNKRAKFGVNRFVRYRSISEHTCAHTHNLNFAENA
jgi:hypothetical protein